MLYLKRQTILQWHRSKQKAQKLWQSMAAWHCKIKLVKGNTRNFTQKQVAHRVTQGRLLQSVRRPQDKHLGCTATTAQLCNSLVRMTTVPCWLMLMCISISAFLANTFHRQQGIWQYAVPSHPAFRKLRWRNGLQLLRITWIPAHDFVYFYWTSVWQVRLVTI